MKVNEIFHSIEGEGKRAGLPCTFIRLHGCNLKCEYCDSQYACEGTDYSIMSISEILKSIEFWECPFITVTGGEPLIHPGIEQLLIALKDVGYEVNVETNGTQMPIQLPRVFYTMDYKTNASGMSDRMNEEAFKNLVGKDVVKFVVGSKEDLEQALEFVERINLTYPSIYISPVYGKIEACELVEFMQQHRLYNWRVQLQLHKYIWNPEMRGV